MLYKTSNTASRGNPHSSIDQWVKLRLSTRKEVKGARYRTAPKAKRLPLDDAPTDCRLLRPEDSTNTTQGCISLQVGIKWRKMAFETAIFTPTCTFVSGFPNSQLKFFVK